MQQRGRDTTNVNGSTLSYRSGSVGSCLGGAEMRKRWQNTLRTTRDRSLGGASNGSGNPYIDGMHKLGLNDISRARMENRELHQARNRLNLKNKLMKIQASNQKKEEKDEERQTRRSQKTENYRIHEEKIEAQR